MDMWCSDTLTLMRTAVVPHVGKNGCSAACVLHSLPPLIHVQLSYGYFNSTFMIDMKAHTYVSNSCCSQIVSAWIHRLKLIVSMDTTRGNTVLNKVLQVYEQHYQLYWTGDMASSKFHTLCLAHHILLQTSSHIVDFVLDQMQQVTKNFFSTNKGV